MSLLSRAQLIHGPEAVAAHPHFAQAAWVQQLLADPERRWTPSTPGPLDEATASNTMFTQTLSRDADAVLAHLSFTRPCREPTAAASPAGGPADEECWLMSLGHGVDGATARAHGGFSVLILDQICGSIVHHQNPRTHPPATATLSVDFRAEVRTPSVVLLRAWVESRFERKVWVRAVLEDSTGRVCVASRGLFVYARDRSAKL